MLPERPPYFPRQFGRCAVIGNSGDLLKTRFGNEIDDYEVVIRENGAPIQVSLGYIMLSPFLSIFFPFLSMNLLLILSFLIFCRTIQIL